MIALREKSLYSEFFWSVFSCIWTEYGEVLRISPYPVRIWENAEQKNPEYGYFSRSVKQIDSDFFCHDFKLELQLFI